MAGLPGRSGRRAKPTARKELAGNPGKRALNKSELAFTPITAVAPPDWLDETASTMWVMIAKELCAQRVLCATDLHNLEIFCMAYSTFRRSHLHLKAHGVVMIGATGGPIKNPSLTAINECSRQMASFGALLGLDPSSRQRLVGGNTDKNSNPWKDI
ncbi:phage terminase small subunit P27 family [Yersinia ruckeri]|uniref:phage terminase small subunit P27 family n=1 Tax=Yersinia ruckeri TaxID=29486 RepID=UPI002237225B|nr:phage terminase small subunit P27 family [Yersinia ruckeri]EKN4700368.1 phage terminase small subunit P27 family [Yersinia ruckeri]MCW6583587.1 phage terminase small subunit P27 family [Yersinia ruckeri]